MFHLALRDAKIVGIDHERHSECAAGLVLAFGAMTRHLLNRFTGEFISNGATLAPTRDVHVSSPQSATLASR